MIELTAKKRSRGRPSLKKEIDFEKILDIAAKEFAQNGFEGTKMSVIAAKAGYAKSLMNYHFKNKELLWKRAVSKLGMVLQRQFESAEGYFKDLDGVTLMKAFNRQFIYFSAEHPSFYKIVFHEMGTATERAKWLLDEILQPIHQLTEEQVKASPNGQEFLGGITTAHFFSLIIGAANVFFIHAFQIQHQYGIDPFDKREIEKYADFVNETVFARFENRNPN